MSLAIKAFNRGIARLFNLPRLTWSLVLGLGFTLGAVLCVMAVTSELLLKPLPGIEHSAQLYSVEVNLNFGTLDIDYLNPLRINHLSKHFVDAGQWAGIKTATSAVEINGTNYEITQFNASANISDVLGTKVLLGKAISPHFSSNELWISSSLWRSAYGESEQVIGQLITRDNQKYVIAGVLADVMAIKSNQAILTQQIWLVEDYSKAVVSTKPNVADGAVSLVVFKPKIADQNIVNRDSLKQWFSLYLEQEIHNEQMRIFISNIAVVTSVSPFRVNFLDDSYQVIMALIATVFGLLLMASLNLINLFMSYYQSRNKEFAIQLSVGSSVARLRFLIFVENLPSFIIAGIVGLLVSGWLIKALPLMTNQSLPLLDAITIDTLTLIMAMVLIIGLALIFSLLGLVDVNKSNLINSLHSSGKGTSNQNNYRLSRGLMVLQLMIASILMTGSVMLAKNSFDYIYRDLGFEINNHYQLSFEYKDKTLQQSLNSEKYQGSALQTLHQELANTIEQSIDNAHVIIADQGPLAPAMRLIGFRDEEGSNQQYFYQDRSLSPSYFESFKIKLLAGSYVSQQQIDAGENLVVIDSNFAKMLYPKLSYQEILGKSLPTKLENFEVVLGIVEAVGLHKQDQAPVLYSSNINLYSQFDFTIKLLSETDFNFSQLQQVFEQQHPLLRLTKIQSLQAIFNDRTAAQRTSLIMLIVVAALTLLLAAIGVSSLTLMTTHQKKYQLAIRMATGASQWRLLKFIVSDAILLLFFGLASGFVVSVFGYGWLQGEISLLPDFDWFTLIVLDISLVIIVLLSVVVPSWRVIKQDPISALRQE